jgi:hypothetical protein
MRPELGGAAADFTPETVLTWDVDWANFVAEYPRVRGTAVTFQHRLAAALRASTSHHL